MKAELHRAYLSIGSNIQPEHYLPKAVALLAEYGHVQSVSQVWESHAVGSDGPNFLNACLLFLSSLEAQQLKEEVIRDIEARLGRVRGPDKFAPRTVDLDIVLFDGQTLELRHWQSPFVLVPLAELVPDFQHPLTAERIDRVAQQVRLDTWIVPRPDIKISSE